jgi:hypothetical protein
MRWRRTRLDEDPGDLVGRRDGSWLTKLEEPTIAAQSISEKACLPQRGFGASRLPGADLEPDVAVPFERLAVELLDEPATMDDADARGEAIDLGEDVARDGPR